MSQMKNVIWIDLDNSPHVLFFKPIIEALNSRGYKVYTTARDAFQVKELVKNLNVPARLVGRHHGKNKLLKVIGLFLRAVQLMPALMKEKPDLAVSHGSRAQMISSRLLRIKTIVMLDYEFVKFIPFFLPDYVILPEAVSAERFLKRSIKVLHYPHIKENVYLPFFTPNAQIATDLSLQDDEKIIITLREPATEAHYFVQESEEIFEAVIDYLLSYPHILTVILPRNAKRQLFIKNRWREALAQKKILVLEHAVDALSLMWYSDLVISGGGTMNREAATMGVPVYSIFQGKTGAVDHYLSETGRLTIIRNKEDIKNKIGIQKRLKKQYLSENRSASLDSIITSIETIAKE